MEAGPAFAYLLEVEGTKAVFAWWVGRDTTLWEIFLVPDDANSDINVVLPAERPCRSRGGICASGGRTLTTRLEHTIAN